MVLDSSVLIAILCQEAGHQDLERLIVNSSDPIAIAAPVLFESAMVLTTKLKCDGHALVMRFLADMTVDIISFSAEHSRVAFRAFHQFGKGRHPAALNFGDCMSYAAAKLLNEPLLFVGNDFSQTDIAAA